MSILGRGSIGGSLYSYLTTDKVKAWSAVSVQALFEGYLSSSRRLVVYLHVCVEVVRKWVLT